MKEYIKIKLKDKIEKKITLMDDESNQFSRKKKTSTMS